MRTPSFWYAKPGVAAKMLAPLGFAYAKATAIRLSKGQRQHLDVPVICVGNLVAGGTGKTPTSIAIAQRLIARGKQPAFVTRGYGGNSHGVRKVVEAKDSANEVGDEPLLLAAFAPTWVSKDRLAGALAAQGEGVDAIILDDGFQNPSIFHDLSLIVSDAQKGFGNGYCIPAGPLREPVNVGLRRANILLSIGDEEHQNSFEKLNGFPQTLGRLKGRLDPLQTGMDWNDLRVLAFAGIGHPEKFFATLRKVGANIVESLPLADHQPIDGRMFQRLIRRANELGARLVCTEKDAVKLPQAARKEVLTLPVRLGIKDWDPIDQHFDRLGL